MSSQASARELRTVASVWRPIAERLNRGAGSVFILPAVLVILGFSIFPLIASLYISMARLNFSEGGVELKKDNRPLQPGKYYIIATGKIFFSAVLFYRLVAKCK